MINVETYSQGASPSPMLRRVYARRIAHAVESMRTRAVRLQVEYPSLDFYVEEHGDTAFLTASLPGGDDRAVVSYYHADADTWVQVRRHPKNVRLTGAIPIDIWITKTGAFPQYHPSGAILTVADEPIPYADEWFRGQDESGMYHYLVKPNKEDTGL